MVSKEPVLKCEGPCKNYYHGECARGHGLVVPNTVKPIPPKAMAGQAKKKQSSFAENDSSGDRNRNDRSTEF